jgi:hypothetical protein
MPEAASSTFVVAQASMTLSCALKRSATVWIAMAHWGLAAPLEAGRIHKLAG